MDIKENNGKFEKFVVGGYYSLSNNSNKEYICFSTTETTNKYAFEGKEIRFLRVRNITTDSYIDKKFYVKLEDGKYVDISTIISLSSNELNNMVIKTQKPYVRKDFFDELFYRVLEGIAGSLVMEITKEIEIRKNEMILERKAEIVEKSAQSKAAVMEEIIQAKTISDMMENKSMFTENPPETNDTNISTNQTVESEESEVGIDDLKSKDLTVTTIKPKKSLKRKNKKFSHIQDRRKFVEDYKSLRRINKKKIDEEDMKIFRLEYGIEDYITNADISNFANRIKKELGLS